MKSLLVGFFLFFFCLGNLRARTKPPRLTAWMMGKKVELVLERLDVQLNACGPGLEAKMTMVFFNPHDEELVGELQFPIPPNATITGYALDINGHMRDGVITERTYGRDVFERIVDRRIDPGLMEWAGSEAFTTEVYPIAPGGRRTVAVSYITTVTNGRIRVPLAFDMNVREFRLSVDSVHLPKIIDGDGFGLVFSKYPKGFHASVKAKMAHLKQDLILELRTPPLVQQSADGMNYFALFCRLPDVPHRKQEIEIRRLAVFWDASGSRRSVKHAQEIEFLRKLLESIGTLRVDLTVFRHSVPWTKTFVVREGTCPGLFSELANIVYDGATKLELPRELVDPAGTIVLLFGDGEITLGNALPHTYPAPVYSVTAGPLGIAARRLAILSSGAVLDLSRSGIPLLVHRVLWPARRVTTKMSGNVELLAPGPLTPWLEDTWLYGRFRGERAKLTVGIKGRTEQTSCVLEAGAKGETLRRLWAHGQRHRIEMLGETGDQDLVQLGKRHSIVTPKTSFIVLESLDQYLQYELRPPTSEPELCIAYDRKLEENRRNDPFRDGDEVLGGAESKGRRPDRLIRRWKAHTEFIEKLRKRGWFGSTEARRFRGDGERRNLTWITRVQNADGSWGEGRYRAAHTGLVLLSFLSYGQTPISEHYGYSIQRGMQWLASYLRHPISHKISQEPAGTYAHAMASYAMAESYAMTQIPFLKIAMDEGINVIVKGQLDNGGFNYGYRQTTAERERSDLSLTAWNAKALKSARVAGSDNPKLKEAIARTIRFVRSTYLPDGSGFSYCGGSRPSMTLTGAATSTLQLLGAGATPEAQAGIKLIMAHQGKNLQRVIDHSQEWDDIAGENLYSWYFDTEAMFCTNWQYEHRDCWKTWSKLYETALLKHRKPEGYWETNGKYGIGARTTSGRILATALGTMMFHNYYRYLPTFDIRKMDNAPAPAPQPVIIPMSSESNIRRRQPTQRPTSEDPISYIDRADNLFLAGKPDLAVRMLSNLAELKLDRLGNLRAMATRLVHYGRLAMALEVCRNIADLPDADGDDAWRLVRVLVANGKCALAMEEVNRRFTDEASTVDTIEKLNDLYNSLPQDANATFPLEQTFRKQDKSDLRIRVLWATSSSLSMRVSLPGPTEADLKADELAVVDPRRQSWGRDFVAYNLPAGTCRVEVSLGYPSGRCPNYVFAQVEIVKHSGMPNETRQRLPVRIKRDRNTMHYVCDVSLSE